MPNEDTTDRKLGIGWISKCGPAAFANSVAIGVSIGIIEEHLKTSAWVSCTGIDPDGHPGEEWTVYYIGTAPIGRLPMVLARGPSKAEAVIAAAKELADV